MQSSAPTSSTSTPCPSVSRVSIAVPTLRIQNIVATVILQVRLELRDIALHARNVEYNPKRFPAAVIRIREPQATGLVFGSGKLVIVGAKSEDLARLAARKFTRIIQKIGYRPQFSDFRIRNVVASCDLGFHIRLEGLARKHMLFSSYEPEIFPGLIYRMVGPRASLLVFSSGKIVITGPKCTEVLYEVFEKMYPVLCEFYV